MRETDGNDNLRDTNAAHVSLILYCNLKDTNAARVILILYSINRSINMK